MITPEGLAKRLNIKLQRTQKEVREIDARVSENTQGINNIANQYQASNRVFGMDIYIQNTEPDIPGDFVWIDTNGIDLIER